MAHATNNRMELAAILEGLRAVRRPGQSIAVYTDSLAAVSWLTGRWRIKDPEIRRLATSIQALVDRMGHQVTYHHVRGHAGHLGNERADALAQAQARRLRVTLTP